MPSYSPFLGSSSPSWVSLGDSGPSPGFQALSHGSAPSVIACLVPVRVGPAYPPPFTAIFSVPSSVRPCSPASESFHTARACFTFSSAWESLLGFTVSSWDASSGKPSQNATPRALYSGPGSLLWCLPVLCVLFPWWPQSLEANRSWLGTSRLCDLSAKPSIN